MRRKLLRAAHPDQGGDHLFFLWCQKLLDFVGDDSIEPKAKTYPNPARRPESETDRVGFDDRLGFDEITRRAAAVGDSLSEPYRSILACLGTCYAPVQPTIRHRRGASYRQLAFIGHLVGLSADQRRLWYRIAEELALTDAHGGYLIDRLKERVA